MFGLVFLFFLLEDTFCFRFQRSIKNINSVVMVEQIYSFITIVIVIVTGLISLYRGLTVNKKNPAPLKPWDTNKITMVVILGLLSGLAIATGLKITIVSISAYLTKEEIGSIECVHSNVLLSQLVNTTGNFSIAGLIFIVLGVRGLVVLLKKDG